MLTRLLPLLVLTVAAGCSTPKAEIESSVALVPEARSVPMFDGRDGAPMTWDALMDAVGGADIVVVGEQHDDALGHAFQLALVEDIVAQWPGSAVSMEMLERDEQDIVDDFEDDIIATDDLIRLTHSSSWGGPGGWMRFYQPIVDAAKAGGGTVVAANAPRRYVRLARTDGYERIEALPASRRALVALPTGGPHDAYGDRFRALMTDDTMAHELSDVEMQQFLRSQLVWDATMAQSIAETHRAGAPRVVHLVGRFHADFDGGLVEEIRARVPSARILVISMGGVRGDALRDDDRGRADVVVYTGSL